MAGRGEGMVFRSNKGMEQKQERAAPPSYYPLTTARRHIIQLRLELEEFAKDCGLATFDDDQVIEMIRQEIETQPS
jgi:hypothetical protein